MNERNGAWGPVRRTFGCLALLLVLVVLPVGCVVRWWNNPIHEFAREMDDYGTLCGGREIPGAAEYTPGPGPHPIVVFGGERHSDAGRTDLHFYEDEAGEPFRSDDPGQIQLVACTEDIDVGERVGGCDFDSESVPLHRATVEVQVYEARTGEKVGDPVELVGEDDSCPVAVVYQGSLGRLYTVPTKEQYASALAGVVNG
ncbi:hypothetical protein [Nocardiopsis lucentensis]|uniref:hypothetical protein n=1 Tax=Nocardiopsis lucentensis TaxID=53441 RepID=UPI00034964D8|nr:hypothetical protein [Nocardiopsis lucentensis]